MKDEFSLLCPFIPQHSSFQQVSPMDLTQIAKDTAKTVTSYLTYRAVRVVVAQLSETNPPQAIWLSRFSSQDKIQDGEAYLQALMQADQGLALRIMTVRSHLAQEIVDFLPEMVRAGIDQANMEHRRQYLERVTLISTAEPLPTEPSGDSHPDDSLPTDSTDP
jgi:hypothetical protein